MIEETKQDSSIGDEYIKWAYRLFLDRDPESQEAVEARRGLFRNISELRAHFLSSDEYLANNPEAYVTKALGLKPSISVDLKASEEDLKELYAKVAETWAALGEQEPHWSVMTHKEFKQDSIENSVDAFYKTGLWDEAVLLKTLERNGICISEHKDCLELGCGVGRITKWLSKHFEKVLAYDISKPHLREAQKYFDAKQIKNVYFNPISSIEQIDNLPDVDFVYSIIVLQHNPPPIAAIILKKLLNLLRPNGVVLFQVATYKDDYSFDIATYCDKQRPIGEMEMHAMPQRIVFEILESCNCRLLEVADDISSGRAEGLFSNTFLAQKRSVTDVISS